MSTGFYGSISLASSVQASSTDVFYAYSSSRNTLPSQLLPLFPSGPTASDLVQIPGSSTGYSLRLPANILNTLGFYYITITPKAYLVNITSCGNVISTSSSASPSSSIQVSKNGIIIPSISIGSTTSNAGGLIGYRVQYFDSNSNILPYSRIITSSDAVSPSNSNSLNQNSASFTLDSSGSYQFLTLAADQQSLLYSQSQALGQAGQSIILSNSTLFDPVTIEVELTDVSLQTLNIGVFGNSTRDLGNGQYTLYDSNGNLYAQYLLAQTKNTVTNAIVEFKQQIPNPAPNQTFLSTTQGL